MIGYSLLWRLLAFTGMRRNEALALKCSDVRVDQGQLSVRSALGVADRGTYVARPKSDAERVIELDKADGGRTRSAHQEASEASPF